MQFIKAGPDIPDRLIQGHEDGDVVFFCGSGISFPAGLPGFLGLVQDLYSTAGVIPNEVQSAAIEADKLDTAIGLLEAFDAGGQKRIRRALTDILDPDLGAPDALATHKALLTLAKSRHGQTRLITTNFDRLFEEANGAELDSCKAPLLRVPKRNWSGLVYLHGLLSSSPTEVELNDLVLSSGDFGRAYLTERWAARFVGELFKNYMVCFVGYSLNDPVLRYMTDAMAADRLLGEPMPEMFAFGSFKSGEVPKQAAEWQSKGVTPILYEESPGHLLLHQTLRAWAANFRDGINGKESVVVEAARALPVSSTRQDDCVGRLLWALVDPTGLPARKFATLNPAPALDWLKPLSEQRYDHRDLIRFGVTPNQPADQEIQFSILRRPTPYNLAPNMSLLFDAGFSRFSRWDQVMTELARWLIRHLNNPKLFFWIIDHGPQLHGIMAVEISRRLLELTALEENKREIEEIRSNSPDAIPNGPMRILWNILLAGLVRSDHRSHRFAQWRRKLRNEGWSFQLRLQLKELMAPKVSLRRAYRWPEVDEYDREDYAESVRQIADWEVLLSADGLHVELSRLNQDPTWMDVLPSLLDDVSSLLKDALELQAELGGATSESDRTYIFYPSISEHEQNRNLTEWTALIRLARDSWLETVKLSPERARLAAETWWLIPYPIFRRLAFFAATGDQSVVSPSRALEWVLSDNCWWLWSIESQREAIRLLVAIAPRLDDEERERLEAAVLAGPPRKMFNEDLEPQRVRRISDREKWVRLAKISHAGVVLGEKANQLFDQLSRDNTNWSIAEDERDEFPFWSGGSTFETEYQRTPLSRDDLANWLQENPDVEHWDRDDWRERCRDDFQIAAGALADLANQSIWPVERWRTALMTWAGNRQEHSWQEFAVPISEMPQPEFEVLCGAVASWLQGLAAEKIDNEKAFFLLCRRVLLVERVDEGGLIVDDAVDAAINHPVGYIAGALLTYWKSGSLDDGQNLPEELAEIFSIICDTEVIRFRHGRLILATNVVAIFRVDRSWCTKVLLPIFSWRVSLDEALIVWQGFLRSPRIFEPLLDELKESFLATASHYGSLGRQGRQYAALLAFVALEHRSGFTFQELAMATAELPEEGLRESSEALTTGLDGAGDRRADYWRYRVQPYLHRVWPKTHDKVTPEVSEGLARVCIAAGHLFPDAVNQVVDFLTPVPHPDFLVSELHEANLCHLFPVSSLVFLSTLIGGEYLAYPPEDLMSCLQVIQTAKAELREGERFLQLVRYLRVHGLEF